MPSPGQNNNLHILFNLPLAKVYSNSLMSSLNSRAWGRTVAAAGGDANNALPLTNTNTSDAQFTTIAVRFFYLPRSDPRADGWRQQFPQSTYDLESAAMGLSTYGQSGSDHHTDSVKEKPLGLVDPPALARTRDTMSSASIEFVNRIPRPP